MIRVDETMCARANEVDKNGVRVAPNLAWLVRFAEAVAGPQKDNGGRRRWVSVIFVADPGTPNRQSRRIRAAKMRRCLRLR